MGKNEKEERTDRRREEGGDGRRGRVGRAESGLKTRGRFSRYLVEEDSISLGVSLRSYFLRHRKSRSASTALNEASESRVTLAVSASLLESSVQKVMS